MIRRPVLAAAAVLLALAVPAFAATPVSGGLYEGRTSQDRGVAVRAGTGETPDHVRRFVIRWKTRCPGTRLTYFGRAALERLRLGELGGFRGSVLYRERLSRGYRARVFVKVAGRFTSRSRVAGKWRGAVRLFRYGQQVSYCRSALISWSARLTD